MRIKTTNEIIRDSARYIKDEILVLSDNGYVWVSAKDIEAQLFNIKNQVMRECITAKSYCKAIELFDEIRVKLDNSLSNSRPSGADNKNLKKDCPKCGTSCQGRISIVYDCHKCQEGF